MCDQCSQLHEVLLSEGTALSLIFCLEILNKFIFELVFCK